VDSAKRKITVEEKDRIRHTYQISKEGILAIQDYVDNERGADNDKWQSPALFLSIGTNSYGNGRLTVRVINLV